MTKKRTVELLSPRNRRVLGKIGLMPLTSKSNISARFGLPINYLETLPRLNIALHSTKLALIERFERSPAKQGLLFHPKLWAYWRVRDLARDNSVPEIFDILKREAAELNVNVRNPATPSAGTRWKPINTKTISSFILKNGLRTKDDIRRMFRRIMPPRRPENRLSPEERDRLVVTAFQILKRRRFKRYGNLSGDELRDLVSDRIQSEVRLFNPGEYRGFAELERRWIGYLFTKRKSEKKKNLSSRFELFVIDALRNHGPYSRSGRSRQSIAYLPEENFPVPKPRLNRFQLTPKLNALLTPTERLVAELIAAGNTSKQIAFKRGVTMPTVSSAIGRIRQKMRLVE